MIEVSVVIPYNGSSYFDECLDSIRLSDIHLFDFEILIIIPKNFEYNPKVDLNCRVVNQDGVGLANALNLGLKLSRGEFIFRIDADDLCSSNRFSLQINALRASPNLIAVGGQLDKFYLNEKLQRVQYPITKNLVRSLLPYLSPIPHPGLVFKRKAIELGTKYDEGLSFCEDWDFIFQLSRIGDLNNVVDVVGSYRVHENQMSNDIELVEKYSVVVLKKNLPKSTFYGKYKLDKFPLKTFSSHQSNYYVRLYVARTRIKRSFNISNCAYLSYALCCSPLKFFTTFYLYAFFVLQKLFLKYQIKLQT